MRIAPETKRAAVLAAQVAGKEIHTANGYDVSMLYCPHCDLWIRDPEDPSIAHVSEDHDVGRCDDNDPEWSGPEAGRDQSNG